MFSLIPWWWRWAALAVFAAGLWGHGYTSGLTHEANRRDALDAAQFRAAVSLGNRLSGRLAAQNARTNEKTVEVLRHVPKVTIGRKCLDVAAVRLLNDAAPPHLPAAAGKSVDSPAAVAATDGDVAGWIAAARGQYQSVADQLNALIDYTVGKDDEFDKEVEP